MENADCVHMSFDCHSLNSSDNESPKAQISSSEETIEIRIGQQLTWCVSGRTLGVHSAEWSWPSDPNLETINITTNVSDQPCLKCSCIAEDYSTSHPAIKQLLESKILGGARGVAFSVLGYVIHNPSENIVESWRCSGVASHYLSFVIIDEMKPGDNQTLMFNIISAAGDITKGTYPIQVCEFVRVRIIHSYLCWCLIERERERESE